MCGEGRTVPALVGILGPGHPYIAAHLNNLTGCACTIALRIAEDHDWPEGRMGALNLLGLVELRIGPLDAAVEHFEQH